MERRHFLKLAFGFAAGAAALVAGAEAEAAPLAPQPITKDPPPGNADAQPAVTTGDEADRLAPEPVRWGRGRRRGWGRRGWGWRRRGWRRRRHWGFRRRWRRRRRIWRRRYW
ncbi:MAG: twin-arginine translocation signal domain-containing protein [Bradyrhizobium sp.]|uniref:twin-arginine translocation signal domain-containing protein n=1 Tax=Bradyrhizobium sp. TaxID=376 RepID=UPI00271C2F9D|nr:twin-arginine translocation signal domain-containing protein [Bradyrhizobium sp.]MDO8400698.1 twin-arginine translocation signal domain-containing protein [Bradyrhizobium sp.]